MTGPPGRGGVLRWLVLVGGVCCWEVATRAADNVFFPPPSEIFAHGYRLWFAGPPRHLLLTDTAIHNILPSLGRMLVGLAISVLIGGTLGVALGRSRHLHAYLDPVLQFARAVPPPTMVPILIVVFALGTPMQIASIVFGGVWPVLLNTAEAARGIDPMLTDTARVFAIPRYRVLLPAVLPGLAAGLRLALSLSLILMVFSELLPGSADGIGFQLTDAQSRSDLPTVWAAIVLLGVLGYLSNAALSLGERRMLAWHSAARGTQQ